MPGLDKISEWMGNFVNYICEVIYKGLWYLTNILYTNMNSVLSNGMTLAHDTISQTPKEWNYVGYVFIKTASENAVIPVAACMISFVFSWQLISMVQESNQMHNIKPENMVVLLVKLGVCLLVCAKSFEIVNGLFDVSKWAVDNLPSGFSSYSGTIEKLPVPETLTSYNFGNVFEMLMNLLLTLLAEIITYVLVVVIYVRVNIWFVELLIYMAAAPMPFSTFLNKEWGQIGMNYLRKILALVFEGFFMLLAFGLYQAITGKVLNGFSTVSDSYLMSMVTSVGCGVAMFGVLNKCGSISASVFNAH
ncbi:MAG: VirB6/TrbL-like conjugal transfer protein, CD1112 family [Suilimivivens sp.]